MIGLLLVGACDNETAAERLGSLWINGPVLPMEPEWVTSPVFEIRNLNSAIWLNGLLPIRQERERIFETIDGADEIIGKGSTATWIRALSGTNDVLAIDVSPGAVRAETGVFCTPDRAETTHLYWHDVAGSFSEGRGFAGDDEFSGVLWLYPKIHWRGRPSSNEAVIVLCYRASSRQDL